MSSSSASGAVAAASSSCDSSTTGIGKEGYSVFLDSKDAQNLELLGSRSSFYSLFGEWKNAREKFKCDLAASDTIVNSLEEWLATTSSGISESPVTYILYKRFLTDPEEFKRMAQKSVFVFAACPVNSSKTEMSDLLFSKCKPFMMEKIWNDARKMVLDLPSLDQTGKFRCNFELNNRDFNVYVLGKE